MAIEYKKAISRPLSVVKIEPGVSIYDDAELEAIQKKQSSAQRIIIIKRMRGLDRIFQETWKELALRCAVESNYPLVWNLSKFGMDAEESIKHLVLKSLNFHERNAVNKANRVAAGKGICVKMSDQQMEVVNGFVILDQQYNLFSDDGLFVNDYAPDEVKSNEYFGWSMNGDAAVYVSEDGSLLISIQKDGSWKVQKYGQVTFNGLTHEGIIAEITGAYEDECQLPE